MVLNLKPQLVSRRIKVRVNLSDREHAKLCSRSFRLVLIQSTILSFTMHQHARRYQASVT